ncbi:MAG TPA: class I SAM-dependent methyltransferase [Acidimicrobiales bacterium]
MGIWAEQVLPRFTEKAMARDDITALRTRAVAGLAGEIVELGFGSGLNVPHYPADVKIVHAIEPSELAKTLAGDRVAASPVDVRFTGLEGEALPLDDESVDGALSTFTLCTIPDVRRALGEVRRVLRPGGAFHFAEHGLSPERDVAKWQARVNPVQKKLFGGCHVTRHINELILDAGFDVESVATEYLPGPSVAKPWGYVYVGIARNAPV